MRNEYEDILRFFTVLAEFYYINSKVFVRSHQLTFFFGAVFGMMFLTLLILILNA